MNKIRILDLDVIFLSYDEPNAEKNYADLMTKAPWAKRVHGIKGSDAAHKACAELSDTERFITVDADNIVRPDFFNQVLDFDEEKDLSNCVISWAGFNVVNSLMYGNGGLKCWPKKYVLNMKTHENAPADDPNAQVDFCWDAEYIQMNSCYSDVYNNATPFQAWRAGFREGVKMSLDQGVKVPKEQFQTLVHWKNLHRLMIWLNVGQDSTNGAWAILGARHGCYKTNLTDWDYVNVRDFEYLKSLYNEEIKGLTDEQAVEKIDEYGKLLSEQLDLPCTFLDKNGSRFFKTVYQNPERSVKFIDKE